MIKEIEISVNYGKKIQREKNSRNHQKRKKETRNEVKIMPRPI